jgi:hypothetical protein
LESAAGDGCFVCNEIVSDGFGFGLDRGQVRSPFRRLSGFHLELGQGKASIELHQSKAPLVRFCDYGAP